MKAPVEHELHHRRLSRNVGLGLVLGALVAILFGLSVAKVRLGDDLRGFDHTPAPVASEATQ